MNAHARNWPSQALWLILAISASWVIYLFASKYLSCRADGTGQLFCFIITLVFGCVQILIFVVSTVAKILMAILP